MIAQSLLPEFDHECATTRRVLERVPDEAAAWKPHEKSFSMQELATHLVQVPSWMEATVLQDGIDMAGGYEPPEPGTREELLQRFDEHVAKARAILEGASDETLMQEWKLHTGDEVHFALPKAAVLRSFVMNHMIHHRAQLALYLRLKDVPVPSIYGPSADEAGM
jgi:uncharacterized damage-inducible protein DinB